MSLRMAIGAGRGWRRVVEAFHHPRRGSPGGGAQVAGDRVQVIERAGDALILVGERLGDFSAGGGEIGGAADQASDVLGHGRIEHAGDVVQDAFGLVRGLGQEARRGGH